MQMVKVTNECMEVMKSAVPCVQQYLKLLSHVKIVQAEVKAFNNMLTSTASELEGLKVKVMEIFS